MASYMASVSRKGLCGTWVPVETEILERSSPQVGVAPLQCEPVVPGLLSPDRRLAGKHVSADRVPVTVGESEFLRGGTPCVQVRPWGLAFAGGQVYLLRREPDQGMCAISEPRHT